MTATSGEISRWIPNKAQGTAGGGYLPAYGEKKNYQTPSTCCMNLVGLRFAMPHIIMYKLE